MSYSPVFENIPINDKVSIRLIQDSIWNHYDELERLYISFKLEDASMSEYFEKIDKVSYYRQMEFYNILVESSVKGYSHIGFTPHYWYQYDKNYKNQLVRFIKETETGTNILIDFYYLSSWFSSDHLRRAVKKAQRER